MRKREAAKTSGALNDVTAMKRQRDFNRLVNKRVLDVTVLINGSVLVTVSNGVTEHKIILDSWRWLT